MFEARGVGTGDISLVLDCRWFLELIAVVVEHEAKMRPVGRSCCVAVV